MKNTPPENTLAAATGFALKLLGIRNHSHEELERKLRKKGFQAELCATVLEQLVARGLLNDRTFGEEMLQSRSQRKPSGKLKMRAELLNRGIASDIADELLSDYKSHELCHQAAAKKIASLRIADEAIKKRKVETFLRNRGFGWQEISTTLHHFFPTTSTMDDDIE
uniref:Regulatory protein RecX n=1 Tax=Chlorobium chlorochromatii (strain CaD3) TaxID=340177 RepID=Q3AQ28_CHLCH